MNPVTYILMVVGILAIVIVCCYAFIPSLKNRFNTKKEDKDVIAQKEVERMVQEEPKRKRVVFKDATEALAYIEKKEESLGIRFTPEEIPFLVEQVMIFDEIYQDE